ncbi:LytTR family DNA-binding domain-containing protein [Hoyosella sp. YIM 151337]|uniref:LytR/AlgR family response regulator transcription factor n=1 Tax=Hoyosella sp. YIM 151337 TaxID=2992742 RepID=UPI00223679F2|nr:LytTR family DNA-binding domain-containing protein [Hoyosella sp. YIM 151337]MCW4355975.1 LytTR family DNA-binding domain-containing protein [Hoyosella sp. YIM 151337]
MIETMESSAASPLTVLAVDDETPALDELVFLLREQDGIETVHAASDATSALRILKSEKIDAVFSDIRMPGLDGVELAGIVSEFRSPPFVVFVTAHDDRAVDAFDVGAVDYLLKPLRTERLAQAIARIREHRAKQVSAPALPARAQAQQVPSDEVIPVELGGVTTLVRRSTVGWVEADGDYARLHTTTGSHLVRIPLSTLEERWADAGFIRVHRSYLVSLRLVTGLKTAGTGYVVTLRGERELRPVELPVSRRHTRALKDRLVRGPMQAWQAK